jgi:4-carboxymuconolactone decarboxylase
VRIGIFGGSFDPVHNGHLLAAECCREQAGLDRVLFVPAAIGPHKQDRQLASGQHRMEMLALATGALTLAELREAALHLAVYSGWGNGGRLDRAATRVAEALGLPPAEVPPIRAESWDAQERNDQGHAEFAKVMTFPPGPPNSPYLVGINTFVFGEMWRRRGLDEPSRRWITLVGVCESGADIPIRSHIHAAMASGNCQPEEMLEFVLQYGTHAGWPKASRINAVVIEMIAKVEKGLPWNG